jgi:hypothetical protein
VYIVMTLPWHHPKRVSFLRLPNAPHDGRVGRPQLTLSRGIFGKRIEETRVGRGLVGVHTLARRGVFDLEALRCVERRAQRSRPKGWWK